jgi:starch synthase
VSKNKILYVSSEIYPYLPESVISMRQRTLSQAMQEYGGESRTFMPRWGTINERRNQLHEVIRLSGMNLIIDDNDHQLIIKVASIPSARVQVYFIDNDDYFHRKAALTDDDGTYFADNDERAIFFARGVLETVKKLRWEPAVVHCHGWFSAIVPIYLKGSFAGDPVFRGSRIVVSLYNDAFPGTLDAGTRQKIENEGMNDPALQILDTPTYENLMKLVIDYADGVVIEEKLDDRSLADYAHRSGKPVLDWDGDRTSAQYMDVYHTFYEDLLNQ